MVYRIKNHYMKRLYVMAMVYKILSTPEIGYYTLKINIKNMIKCKI